MAITSPRPLLYCTFLDVMNLLMDVSTERINFSQLANILVRGSNQIENYILQADQIINMYLAEAYPTVSSWTTTPWATAPIVPIDPATGLAKNAGTVYLLSAKPNATATSAVWLLDCSLGGNITTAKYTMYSFSDAGQGTSKLFNVDQDSTNAKITIETSAWVDGSLVQSGFSVTAGDQWMFSVNTNKKPVWMLSTTLSTAICLNSIYLGQSTTDSPYGSMFFNRAMSILKEMRDKKLSIEVGLEEFNQLLPTRVAYDINELGQDMTKTLVDQYPGYKSS